MKLLLDQNISRRLVKELKQHYPGTDHVYPLGLYESTDDEIWNFALKNKFIIVSHDSDFYERSLIFGFPPKVIWLRTGNTTTDNIKNLLIKHFNEISRFEKDSSLSCLQIY